jgi:hypothetical protein
MTQKAKKGVQNDAKRATTRLLRRFLHRLFTTEHDLSSLFPASTFHD